MCWEGEAGLCPLGPLNCCLGSGVPVASWHLCPQLAAGTCSATPSEPGLAVPAALIPGLVQGVRLLPGGETRAILEAGCAGGARRLRGPCRLLGCKGAGAGSRLRAVSSAGKLWRAYGQKEGSPPSLVWPSSAVPEHPQETHMASWPCFQPLQQRPPQCPQLREPVPLPAHKGRPASAPGPCPTGTHPGHTSPD